MKIYLLAFVILLLGWMTPAHCENLPGFEENMFLVPGGEFDMGTPPNPNAKYVDDELHRVKVDQVQSSAFR